MNPSKTSPMKVMLWAVLAIIIVAGAFFIYKGVTKQQGAQLWGTLPFPKGVVSTTPLPLPVTSCKGVTVPKITVLSPNGGETYTAGQQVTVRWASCNIPVNGMIGIILNAGGSKMTLLPQSSNNVYATINDGSEVVSLPSAITLSNTNNAFGLNSRIEIGYDLNNANHDSVNDSSDNLFTINKSDLSIHVTSATTAVSHSATGGHDQGRFEVKFRVLNQGTLPLTIHSGCNASNSTGGVSFAIDESGSTILPMFPATSCSLSLTATLSGNDYTLQPGEVQSFDLIVAVTPTHSGQYRLRIPSVRYTLSNGFIGSMGMDDAGNQIKTLYTFIN